MAISPSPSRRPIKKVVPGSSYKKRMRNDQRKSNGWVKWLIISFVVVPILGFGIRLMTKSSDNSDVLRQAHVFIAEAPNYKSNAAYYDSLIEACHPAAFESAYTIGGRHRSNSLNEKEYLKVLFKSMKQKSEADGKKDVSEVISVVLLNL